MLSVMRGAARARLTSVFTATLAAAVTVALAAPASADPVKGKFGGTEADTRSRVNLETPDGERVRYRTNLKRLIVGDKVLLTYCIEATVSIPGDWQDREVNYTESDWASTELGGSAKHVNWILHNSYPNVSLEELGGSAGVSGALSIPDAVAGTQAAIWNYSDGYKLRDGDANPEAVQKVYAYLTGDKNTGLENEPAPTLSLSPETVSGAPGTLLGPIEVTTSAEQVNVAAAGAAEGSKLLGPDKKTEVSTARNGDKLWLSVPKGAEDGSAKITADVTAKVSPGRVFKGDNVKTQTLILASSDEVAVHAESTITWASVPAPAPGSKSEEVCEPDAGVKITLANEGDADAEFTVTYGDTTETETVKAGEAKWKVIPAEEDAAYKITVKSGEYSKTYEGVLDCLKDKPSPSPSGGSGGDLPKTGLNNLTLYLGIGVALFVAGALLLLAVRRRARSEA